MRVTHTVTEGATREPTLGWAGNGYRSPGRSMKPISLSYNAQPLARWVKSPTFMPEDPKIVASALTFGSGGPGGRTPRPPVRRRGVASGIVVPGPRWRHRCRVPGPEGHIAARERHWTDGQRCRHRPSESHFNVTHSSHRIPRWDNEGTGLERHLRCTRTTNLSIGGTNTPIDSGKRFEISSAGQVPPKVFVTVQVFSGTRPTSDKRRAAVRSPGQL